MKAIILAGGFGTRLSEETISRPKPLVEIGGRPILWHIMNIYSAYGIHEFIIAVGYRGDLVKEYFINFKAINNDITIDLAKDETIVHNGKLPPWKIHLVDTGLHTQTGGRLKRLQEWLGRDETFMFTYGDGVGDIDIHKLLEFHKCHGKLATVTTVRSPSRFGRIVFRDDQISEFYEKPETAAGWISGGFFVLSAKALDFIDGDGAVWEKAPVENLVSEGQMMGYRHYGFWSCMDTLKEKTYLEELWNSGKAPWKIW